MDTSVEEDIFQELIEASPNLCLTIGCLEEISAGLPEVISPTRSSTQSTCTDTLSVSSTDYEEREPTVHIQSARASSKEALNSEKAKQNVQDAPEKHSGGEDVLTEYQTTKTLKHSTRRQLVKIVVSHMTETYRRIPTRKQRETYAMGIVTLFPALRDPFSAKGYEHFYDPVKGTGCISWHLKTLSRKNPKRVYSEVSETGGPSRRRRLDIGQQLEGDACREAIPFLVHTADEVEVMQKMKETFKHLQELAHNPGRSAAILKIFPRFLEVKGLVNIALPTFKI